MEKIIDIEQLAREERNEYFRKYRAANPEKVAKANSNYWKRKVLKKIKEQV